MCRKNRTTKTAFTVNLEAAYARAHFAHIDEQRTIEKHRRRGHRFAVGDVVVDPRYPHVIFDVIAISDPGPNEGVYVKFFGDHIEYNTADRFRRATRRQRKAHQAT